MVDVDRGLEKLRELGPTNQLAEGETINDLICPPHGQRLDVRLRLGLNKRGTLVMFEPISGREGPDAWREVGPCPVRRRKRLTPFMDKLSTRQGPAGAQLYYYDPVVE